MPITFERRALYEEVWSAPLTTLAKKYGLSDNGLRKICKSMNIPLPAAGHWARIAAGHSIPRLPLPEKAERKTFDSNPPAQVTLKFRRDEDGAWLKQRTDFDQQEANTIPFELSPKRWHPAIAPLREDCLRRTKEIDEWRRKAERYERLSEAKRRSTINEAAQWQGFNNDGQLLFYTHKSRPLRVSIVTYERALAIFNSLCYAADSRGFSSELDQNEGRVVMSGHEGVVELRMSERLETKIVRERNSWDNTFRNKEIKLPTGLLKLYVGVAFSESALEESKNKRLEDQLDAVFALIYRRIIRCRERDREYEDNRRRWAEEQRIRDEIAQKRADEERARKEELQRRQALVSEAIQWKECAAVREYLAHLNEHLPPDRASDPSTREWFRWAREVTEERNPAPKRLQALGVDETNIGISE